MRRQTATKMDAAMIELLGGQIFEGTQFTSDQVRNLKRVYGFDPKAAAAAADAAVELGRKAYEAKLKEYEERLADRWASRTPRRPEFDEERVRRDALRFQESGDDRNLMRLASHDGRRVMAFLARFLEPDEDPVSLIARALSDMGFDVNLGDLWDEEN